MKLISGLILVFLSISSIQGQEKSLPDNYEVFHFGQKEHEKFHFWKAESKNPTPLLIMIHGGGWANGKPYDKLDGNAKKLFDAGVSVCAITYELVNTKKQVFLPTPVYSAAYALQYIKANAKKLNIQKDNIVLFGGSAGGCTSLWLALHDDIANPKSEDIIKRESTKVKGAVVAVAQTTINPFVIEKEIGVEGAKHGMIWNSVKANSYEDLVTNWDKYEKLSAEFSPMNHVDPSDPPVYMYYNRKDEIPAKDAGQGIHHWKFGKILKDKSDKIGHKAYFRLGSDKSLAEGLSEYDFMKKLFE